jgi:hypothetical protein
MRPRPKRSREPAAQPPRAPVDDWDPTPEELQRWNDELDRKLAGLRFAPEPDSEPSGEPGP